jgi:hypothetical protein
MSRVQVRRRPIFGNLRHAQRAGQQTTERRAQRLQASQLACTWATYASSVWENRELGILMSSLVQNSGLSTVE